MVQKKSERGFLAAVAAGTVLLIFLTRWISLVQNMPLHPDEHVFYFGANSLLNAILHPGLEFTQLLEYPEGSYLFYAPFQLVGKVVCAVLGMEQDLQFWGRIGAVCYFTLGVLLGIRIVWKYLGKNRGSVVLYGLIMAFSLFFLEQSRYGTGDPITVMVLMLLINLTAQATRPGKNTGWWLASFFLCGALGAVKYPQLVFLAIPAWAYLHRTGRRGLPGLMGLLLVTVCGFLLFSPKGLADPGYFLRVIQRETGNYLSTATSHEAGGFWNHLAVLAVYALVYSDLPLMLPHTLRGMLRREQAGDSQEFLFRVVLPWVCGVFFAYNLFVSMLFFRTYTPFFAIITLYTAAAAGGLLEEKGVKSWAVVALAAVMVLRGGALAWALTQGDDARERTAQQIHSAVDENWTDTYLPSMFYLDSGAIWEEGRRVHDTYSLGTLLADNGGDPEIQPGQLVITGAYGYHLGADYLLPVNNASVDQIQAWKTFREVNAPYLVGQAYPEGLYILFGGWLRGGTLSQYEFPVNYIYYRGQ